MNITLNAPKLTAKGSLVQVLVNGAPAEVVREANAEAYLAVLKATQENPGMAIQVRHGTTYGTCYTFAIRKSLRGEPYYVKGTLGFWNDGTVSASLSATCISSSYSAPEVFVIVDDDGFVTLPEGRFQLLKGSNSDHFRVIPAT